jgi:hypothetical protein
LGAKEFLHYLYSLEKQHIYSTREFNILSDSEEKLNKILQERVQVRNEIHKQIRNFLKDFQPRKTKSNIVQLLFELIPYNLPKSQEKSKLFYTTEVLIQEISKKLAKIMSSQHFLTKELKKFLQNTYTIYEMALLGEIAKRVKNQKGVLFLYNIMSKDFASKLLNLSKEKGWVGRKNVMAQLPSWWDVHVKWYISNLANGLASLYIHKKIDLCLFIEEINEKFRQPYDRRGFRYETWLLASGRIAHLLITGTYVLKLLRKQKKTTLYSRLYKKLTSVFFDWIENWEWERITLPKPTVVSIESQAVEAFREIIKKKDLLRYLRASRSVWNAVILTEKAKKTSTMQKYMKSILKNHFESEFVNLPLWALTNLAMRLLNAKYAQESLLVIDYYKTVKKTESLVLRGKEDLVYLIEIIDRVMLKEKDSLIRLKEIADTTKDPEIFLNAHINLKHFDPGHKTPERKIASIRRW